MTSAPTKSDRPSEQMQEAVADLGLAQRGVGLVVGLAGHDPGDDGALRVVAGVLLGDAALVDELLDEGVVLRDLRERVAAEHERPGVADVGHGELVAGAEHDDRRAAHAGEVGVLAHRLGELGVRGVQRLLEQRDRLVGGDVLLVERGELARRSSSWRRRPRRARPSRRRGRAGWDRHTPSPRCGTSVPARGRSARHSAGRWPPVSLAVRGRSCRSAGWCRPRRVATR